MAFSSQHHSFDIQIASMYGIEGAIMIHHFQHWIRINQVAKRNIIDGRCWSYQKRKDILLHYPYWDIDQIRRICEKLVDQGVLIMKNFNQSKFDKTIWYAFADEKAFGVDPENSRNIYERQNCQSSGKIASRSGKNATTIPDTNPTDSKTEEREREAGASSPPNFKKIPPRRKAPEEKKEMASRVFVTPSQHESLLRKANDDPDLVAKWYEKLSQWKISKEIIDGPNDYRALLGWVPDAVKEDLAKKSHSPENRFQSNEAFCEKIKIMCPDIERRHGMTFGHNYVEFAPSAYQCTRINFADNGFEEQLKGLARKLGYSFRES